MTAAAARVPAWAPRGRGRAGARLGATALLHAILLLALVLGLDRVEVARRGVERAMQLVEVTLAPLARPVAPISIHIPRPVSATATPRPRAAPRAPVVPAPREPAAITVLPPPSRQAPGATAAPSSQAPGPAAAPSSQAPMAVAARPASAPASAPPLVLDPDVTRDAVRTAAAAPSSLAQRGQAQTHVGPSTAGERLSQGVATAVKPDCGSAGARFGLLALPVLAYEEAAGKCNN